MHRRQWMICAGVLALALSVCSPALAADSYGDGSQDGLLLGRKDAGFGPFAGGFVLGIFQLGYAIVAPVRDVPEERMIDIDDMSSQYKRGFVDGYRRGKKLRRISKSFLGTLVGYGLAYYLYVNGMWPFF